MFGRFAILGKSPAAIAIILGLTLTALPPVTASPPAAAEVSCPDPTLSASDPKAMWAEGTQADDDGATRDYYNRAAKLEWDNFMGDWRDSAGTPQGETAYATSALVDDDTPGAHTWNVTSLVQDWRAGTPNQGFFLRQVGGAGPFNFYSREHPVADERPTLTVATNMGSFVLAAEADTYLDSSTYQSQGDATTLRIGSYPTLVRFDLSTIPDAANCDERHPRALQLQGIRQLGAGCRRVPRVPRPGCDATG